MTPAEIIESHWEHLVRRLIARSPLLFFKPAKTGLKMDVTEMFGDSGALLPELGADSASVDDDLDADAFFQRVVSGDEVVVSLPSVGGVVRRCERMRRKNHDHFRATGQWGMFMAWPLICVPRDGKATPYYAPLLFWKIEATRVRGGRWRFRLYEDAPVLNFVLRAWLELPDNKINLEWPENVEPGDFSALVQQVRKTLAPWFKEKKGVNKADSCPPTLRPFSDESGKSPVALPCAILGVVDFKYQSLAADLRKLAEQIQASGECGLLDKFLSSGEYNPPPFSGEISESEKWLVERSDFSQESAIWRARDLEVTLLKGPPGTGKSQTIVNMIADALQQSGGRNLPSIAVVCHQRAALNVVRKRLEGVGLGDLVAQVTMPRHDRRDFIQRVRDIDGKISELELPELFVSHGNVRDHLARRIANMEEICDNRALAFVGDASSSFSWRGHCRSRIAQLQEKTGFAPYGPGLPKFQRLRDTIRGLGRDILGNMPEVTAEFSKRWEECDYGNNPWRGIPTDWDIGKLEDLRADFQELTAACAGLQDSLCDLPPLLLLPLVESAIATPHYSALVRHSRKESVRNFLRLIDGTRATFERANLPVVKLWEKFRKGNIGVYEQRFKSVASVPTVRTVASRLAENPVLQAVAELFPGEHSHWPDILDSVMCRMKLDELPPMIPRDESGAARERLIDAIAQKRRADQIGLREQFQDRLQARNALEKRELLRLKSGWGKSAAALRSIYHGAPDHIWRIFPALLTTSDALSQMLPLKSGSIELLIVDEASQMFTADALPLLYRAKRAVICGDNMQMPPTNRFALSWDDGENEDGEVEEDAPETEVPPGVAPAEGRFELLSAAEHLIMPGNSARRELDVHYRSRPAELIEFSNHAFYGGKLQAAPDNFEPPSFMGGRAIRMTHVAGKFNNGVNHEEIAGVISTLREIWSSPDGKGLSVGVIVFNIRQADMLQDKIDEECERDPVFHAVREAAEKLTDDGEDAGFFVRSVEHVQGDERDIIILATTYDGDTKTYGEISVKEKGRRRLNVAVTRAKRGMIVLTSLNTEGAKRIANNGDAPGDKKSKERWFLWKYMQYARAVSEGDKAAKESVLQSVVKAMNSERKPRLEVHMPDSAFEREVGDFLEKNGYTVDFQVGESGFQIDIGVKAAENDFRYLCGIECDGRFWHSGWRARANDVWRQEILESKGWKILRIWSDAWFDDGERTKANILADLKALRG